MEEKKFRHIVRVSNTDIDGNISLYHSLTKIRGVGHMFANAVVNSLKLNKYEKIGNLSIETTKEIEEVIKNPQKFKIPSWMYNRKKDPETGVDKHIVVADLKLNQEFDVKKMKKIKSYKGMRHSFGLPVRGQRTRSNFRRGAALGVQRKGKVGKKR